MLFYTAAYDFRTHQKAFGLAFCICGVAQRWPLTVNRPLQASIEVWLSMVAESRPPIPAEIDRAIRVDARHRCAVCKSEGQLIIHHIIPWATCKEHNPDNLILLCPNCHGRAHANEIDRKSMRSYKVLLKGLDDDVTFIRFNPNSMFDIIDSGNIGSLTDGGGELEFTIVFENDFPDTNYVYRQAANGTVETTVLHQSVGSITIQFVPPCPDLVDLRFF